MFRLKVVDDKFLFINDFVGYFVINTYYLINKLKVKSLNNYIIYTSYYCVVISVHD